MPYGVTIAGVPVSAMTASEAGAVIQTEFDRRLRFRFRTDRWRVSPARFGVTPYLAGTIGRALVAEAETDVPLLVRIDRGKLREYVGTLARRYARAAVSSTLSLRDLRPYITRARAGRAVRRDALADRIRNAVRLLDRPAVWVPAHRVEPAVRRSDYGSIIVIRRGSRNLTLYDGMRHVARFPVAVGMAQYPTPLGRFAIATRERNPTWNPPDSAWAAGMGPIPPGPGNPLGTRWMGLTIAGYGIHGTYADSSIGTAASHGCIRMHIGQNEWLFERVSVGTPVFIVSA